MQEMGFAALLTLVMYRCCRGALGRTCGYQWRHSGVKAVISLSQSAPGPYTSSSVHWALCLCAFPAIAFSFWAFLEVEGHTETTLPLPPRLGSKKAKTQQQSKKAPHRTEIKGLAGKEAATAAWVSAAVQPTSTLLNHVPDCKGQTK